MARYHSSGTDHGPLHHHSHKQVDHHEKMHGEGMIGNEYSERANLPQSVIMKDYSSEGMALPANYPSYGINIVDEQISKDTSKIKSIMDPRKV